jgi:hypothetical protein
MIRPTEKFFLLLFRAKSAALALVRENGWVISAERGLFVLDEGISRQVVVLAVARRIFLDATADLCHEPMGKQGSGAGCGTDRLANPVEMSGGNETVVVEVDAPGFGPCRDFGSRHEIRRPCHFWIKKTKARAEEPRGAPRAWDRGCNPPCVWLVL